MSEGLEAALVICRALGCFGVIALALSPVVPLAPFGALILAALFYSGTQTIALVSIIESGMPLEVLSSFGEGVVAGALLCWALLCARLFARWAANALGGSRAPSPLEHALLLFALAIIFRSSFAIRALATPANESLLALPLFGDALILAAPFFALALVADIASGFAGRFFGDRALALKSPVRFLVLHGAALVLTFAVSAAVSSRLGRGLVMSEEKKYPPTEHRLSELRARGILPRSAIVLDAAAALGAAAGVSMLIPAGVEGAAACFRGERAACLSGSIAEAFFLVIMPIALAVLLVGAIQGRFAFGLAEVQPISRRTLGAMLCSAVLALALGLYGVDLMRGITAEALPRVVLRALWIVAGTLLALGIIDYMVALVRFRERHRMTREEIEAEFREFEMKPEVRQAMGELYRQREADSIPDEEGA